MYIFTSSAWYVQYRDTETLPMLFFHRGPEGMDLYRSGSLKEEIRIGEVDAAKLNLPSSPTPEGV